MISVEELTGNTAKYVGGAFVTGASQRALDWYTNRVADVFDAVFIPATVKNAVTQKIENRDWVWHVEKTLPIDLDRAGRTLRYDTVPPHATRHTLD